MRSNQLKTAQDIANAVKHLAIVLPAIAILLFALAVYLARGRRRRTLRTTGWCFVLIGVVLLLIRRIGGDAVVNGLVKVPSNKPAVHDVWNIGTSLLYSIAVAMIVYGIVIVAAAWLAGPTRPATAIRKFLAPSLRESPAVAYSVVGAVLLLVVLWGPTPAFRNIWWILVFAVLLALGVTMLRRETAREFPGIEHGQALHDFRDAASPSPCPQGRAATTPGDRDNDRRIWAHRTPRLPPARARRDARATGRAARPRRDHQRRVPSREDTRHEQRHLTAWSTPTERGELDSAHKHQCRPAARVLLAERAVSVRDMPTVSRPDLIERRMARFLREPVSVRNAASVIVVATLVVVVAGGVAIRILDHHEYTSIWMGMWWALQTVTTVGYGDVTPKSTSGRFVGAFVMLEGLAFLAIVTAAITSTFVARAEAQRDAEAQAEEELAEDRLDSRLDDLSGRMDRVERLLIKLTEE